MFFFFYENFVTSKIEPSEALRCSALSLVISSNKSLKQTTLEVLLLDIDYREREFYGSYAFR